ncbi:hypothetical protein NFI96_032625 [Prochilodus magdalenae]|nr:hypothetical protein NFI96_032625 [Prochilodus magdalenae]
MSSTGAVGSVRRGLDTHAEGPSMALRGMSSEAGGGVKMWVLCASLVVLHFVASADGSSKAVTTTLTTKWPSTPLLLEASEFLAEESHDQFWDFVRANQDIANEHDGTDLSCYELILKRAGQLLSTVQLRMLKFALSLRSYSATVHSFQQIASNEPPPPGCKAFFSVHGEKSCDPESLTTLIDTAAERPKPFLFKGDHRFPSADAGAPVNPSHSKVFLSGYGVELAIKNQEYKAKDDTQVQGADVNATVIGENDPVDEVQGFLFGKLKTTYPELKEQLKELRKHLVESTNEMAPLKVWQMQVRPYEEASDITPSSLERNKAPLEQHWMGELTADPCGGCFSRPSQRLSLWHIRLYPWTHTSIVLLPEDPRQHMRLTTVASL